MKWVSQFQDLRSSCNLPCIVEHVEYDEGCVAWHQGCRQWFHGLNDTRASGGLFRHLTDIDH